MELHITDYADLINHNTPAIKNLEAALLHQGIIGIKNVPDFVQKSRHFIDTARNFARLEESIKRQYQPSRQSGDNEGYELAAERFQNHQGEWQIDDKKASFYAFVPDKLQNKWPREVDLKTPYLALGQLIFQTGKHVLNAIGLNQTTHLNHEGLWGYGRMLHYHKEGEITNANPDWCGAHLDHGVFTGLLPAYYFYQDQEIAEPAEAGLFIRPTGGTHFEKVEASDKSILLFQAGEFGQLISNDRIKATEHIVKKAFHGIERFTFALFYNADDTPIRSQSVLNQDLRYSDNLGADGSVLFSAWHAATLERYRAGSTYKT